MNTILNTKIVEHLYEPYIFNHITRPRGANHQFSGELVSKKYWDKGGDVVVLTVGAMNSRIPSWVSISSKEGGYGGALFPQRPFSPMDNIKMSDTEMIVWLRLSLFLSNIKEKKLDDLGNASFVFYLSMIDTIKPLLRKRDSDFGEHEDLMW